MTTFNETVSGGSYGAGSASLDSNQTIVLSGGAECGGNAVVPFGDILDGLLIGDACSGPSSTSFCCQISGEGRTVNWLRIKDAYVPAITVCTQRLYS